MSKDVSCGKGVSRSEYHFWPVGRKPRDAMDSTRCHTGLRYELLFKTNLQGMYICIKVFGQYFHSLFLKCQYNNKDWFVRL